MGGRMSEQSETVFSAPDRVFQLWGFTVSMGRLLFRSPKTPTLTTRVDVLFQNVVHLDAPSLIGDFSIALLPTDFEEPRFERFAEEGVGAFSLRSNGSPVGTILASSVRHFEDEQEYYEASPLWPGTGPVESWPNF